MADRQAIGLDSGVYSACHTYASLSIYISILESNIEALTTIKWTCVAPIRSQWMKVFDQDSSFIALWEGEKYTWKTCYQWHNSFKFIVETNASNMVEAHFQSYRVRTILAQPSRYLILTFLLTLPLPRCLASCVGYPDRFFVRIGKQWCRSSL